MQTITTTDTHTTWTLNKRTLNALVKSASKDPYRESLRVVEFDPSKARLAATDGHRLLLAVVSGDKAAGRVVRLRVESLIDLVRAAKAKDTIEIRVPASTAAVTATVGAVTLTLQDDDSCTFPNVDQVVPRPVAEPCMAAAFNATYVAAVSLFAPKTATAKVVFFPGASELDPMLVTASDYDEGIEWAYVVMPIRATADELGYPGYVRVIDAA